MGGELVGEGLAGVEGVVGMLVFFLLRGGREEVEDVPGRSGERGG